MVNQSYRSRKEDISQEAARRQECQNWIEFEYALYQLLQHDVSTTRPTLRKDEFLPYILKCKYVLPQKPDFSSKATTSTMHLDKYYGLEYNLRLKGQFYVNNLNYQKLNTLSLYKELINTPNVIQDQLKVINNLRWSYRYSLLHRRTMNKSHTLTLSKKLLSNGYFDSKSTKNNL